MSHILCINDGLGLGLTTEQMIPAVAGVGFDGIFTGWKDGAPVADWAKLIRLCGMTYQSIHAPFKNVHLLWQEGQGGEDYTDELIRCVHDCAENDVPIAVIHPIIGMERHSPNSLGISRFARLVRAAEECGVKLAFENVEGEEYLEMIIRELGTSPAVGYCWDTGHEMCYNSCRDIPALYGGKLICTHLNDNLKQSDPEKLTWLDDAHMMPLDGLADWEGIARRLVRAGYDGPLTFELTSKNKPGRTTHGIYSGLDAIGFIRRAYAQAKKVAAILEEAEKTAKKSEK